AADILLSTATGGIYTAGRGLATKVAPRAIAAIDKATDTYRLANAGKYALINAGENVVAGAAGNIAAGRDTMEGTDVDAAIGAGLGGLVGGAFKPKAADIQTRADTYTEARTGFENKVEQARQADVLETIKGKLDQEAGIARKVGDTPDAIKPEAFEAEYKTRFEAADKQAREVLGKKVDASISKRDSIIAEKRDASAAKIDEYQRIMDEGNLPDPETKLEYENLIKAETEKFVEASAKLEYDFNNMIKATVKSRNKLVPGSKKVNDKNIRLDELDNEHTYAQYDLKLESDHRIDLYRGSMEEELAAGGAPREVRQKYAKMIKEENELFQKETDALTAEYAEYINLEKQAYNADSPLRAAQASDDAARIVEEQAENLYRRAYQTEADKLGVNKRERLTEDDLAFLQREMGGRSSVDMDRLSELEKYVDDTVPSYQTSTRGEFDPDVYNIPPTNTSFYRDYGGKERLESIIDSKREFAATPRVNNAMEEIALADLMDNRAILGGDLTRQSVDLANLSSAGLISRLSQGVEAGGTFGVSSKAREQVLDSAINTSKTKADKILKVSVGELEEKLAGRLKDKATRKSVEAAKTSLDSIRNKVDKGTEIDATDVAPILEHVSPETLRAVEEMVSLSNYTN
ncbi:MAG: hypothetical protein ACRCZ2_01915, partial [Fusobacteriaceae bacterium]